MSGSSRYYAPMFSVVGGGVAVALFGAAVGLFVALASWQPPELAESSAYAYGSLAFSGLAIGGWIGLVVGMILAWHGGIIGSILDRGDAAPLWGVFTGIIGGFTGGPVLGAVLGLGLGHFVAGGLLGTFFGPVAGVVAWEFGYWSADFLRAGRH